MGSFSVLSKGKCLGLAALVLLSPFGTKAQNPDNNSSDKPKNEVIPRLAAMYPVAVEKVDFELEKRLNINTIPGLIEKSLEYTDLEINNWAFYNALSIRTDKDINFGSKGISLAESGIKRAFNETDLNQNFQYMTGDLASWAANNTAAPLINFVFRENWGSKINHFFFGDIEGLDFELGGSPTKILEPITGSVSKSYGIRFRPLKLELQGHLGGGDYPLHWLIGLDKATLAFRDYPLGKFPLIGEPRFSISESFRAVNVKPLKGDFSYDVFRATTDANFSFKTGKMNVAAGVSYSTYMGNSDREENSDELRGLSGYIVTNYKF